MPLATAHFINRELSWLEFNRRVLHEALSVDKPLYERLKFLAIFSSNLDEFFMVRVGYLYDQIEERPGMVDPSGMTPEAQILAASDVAYSLLTFHQEILTEVLTGLRRDNKMAMIQYEELSELQKTWLKGYYMDNIYPVLTPIAIDNTRAFPLIANKSLNIAVLLDVFGEHQVVTIQVPSVLDRFVEIGNEGVFLPLEEVIKAHLSELLRGRNIIDSCTYRIIRHAGLDIQEDDSKNLLSQIETSLKRRKWGEAVRMDVESSVNPILLNFLSQRLDLDDFTIFKLEGLLDSTAFMRFTGFQNYSKRADLEFVPYRYPELQEGIFEALKEKDYLLYHPYDDFSIVVDMIRMASKDPSVLAIKQVLYRVSGDSSIVRALLEAVENGKQVTVLVELKARFDEENNILWARRLEKSGCHVIYGFHGMKTHSKITLIIRRESGGIKRYVHLGTGNYNDKTARIYTDYGLLTSNDTLANEASMFFNILSGYVTEQEMKKLLVAPYQLRNALTDKINREIEAAKNGSKAYICMKVNSLLDPAMVEKLYEASVAGVEIDLIVRGICSLVPGLKGLSDNIRVISVIGKYLEHSRVYYFFNHGQDELYLASADLMTRNLDRRIEIMFPVEDENHKAYIKGHLKTYLNATEGAQRLLATGRYVSPVQRSSEYEAQAVFEALKGIKGKQFEVQFQKKYMGQ
jgi:polyphosphate kinase